MATQGAVIRSRKTGSNERACDRDRPVARPNVDAASGLCAGTSVQRAAASLRRWPRAPLYRLLARSRCQGGTCVSSRFGKSRRQPAPVDKYTMSQPSLLVADRFRARRQMAPSRQLYTKRRLHYDLITSSRKVDD